MFDVFLYDEIWNYDDTGLRFGDWGLCVIINKFFPQPAIAASLSLRTQLTCKATTDRNVSLNFPEVNVDKAYSLKSLNDALQDLPIEGESYVGNTVWLC